MFLDIKKQLIYLQFYSRHRRWLWHISLWPRWISNWQLKSHWLHFWRQYQDRTKDKWILSYRAVHCEIDIIRHFIKKPSVNIRTCVDTRFRWDCWMNMQCILPIIFFSNLPTPFQNTLACHGYPNNCLSIVNLKKSILNVILVQYQIIVTTTLVVSLKTCIYWFCLCCRAPRSWRLYSQKHVVCEPLCRRAAAVWTTWQNKARVGSRGGPRSRSTGKSNGRSNWYIHNPNH